MTTGFCCNALAAILPNATFGQASTTYTSSLESYWALQEADIQPPCIFQPRSAEHVSLAVGTLSTNKCSFAIRSGGHSPNAGAANIANGVTVDLSQLNAITLSNDQSIASVGPGAVWGDVYSALDPLNLTVAGGREAGVGVGGLTVGGGISYLSPRVGFTCDTVVNFQVVLANGNIVNSQDDVNLDWSLRGGSNNFGVVTRIDFATIEQGLLWGGNVYYLINTIDAQLAALANISNPATYDDYASIIMTLAYSGAEDIQLVVNTIEYTKPEVDPPVFQPLLDIAAIESSMRIDNMSNLATELAESSPSGDRAYYMTITHGNSLAMLNATYQAWSRSVAGITGVAGIEWSLSLEPLPPSIYARHANQNALGLGARHKKGLIITLLTVLWTDETDDAVVEATAKTLFEDIRSAAEALDEYDPFLYLNYANTMSWQGSPISAYGSANVARLKRTGVEVDPSGVFQRLVPGGFKLF
ncbi:hypothetical protein VMCG_09955 [Cytospora schulzeri]|uniref:FAD-binding PCMH-type domain-containing protein n=1 Tax=Cytospora schulzeri TaxID=448051 RepID=A0A423VFD8_9PEZI|nr:hypothetical protein VMCG_09955 [Valsa malicola]